MPDKGSTVAPDRNPMPREARVGYWTTSVLLWIGATAALCLGQTSGCTGMKCDGLTGPVVALVYAVPLSPALALAWFPARAWIRRLVARDRIPATLCGVIAAFVLLPLSTAVVGGVLVLILVSRT